MKTFLPCLAFALALMILADPPRPAEAGSGLSIWNHNCMRIYRQWKKKPGHRAFAVGTANDSESCGASWSAPSKKAAEQSAVKSCSGGTRDGSRCRVMESQ